MVSATGKLAGWVLALIVLAIVLTSLVTIFWNNIVTWFDMLIPGFGRG